MADMQRVEMLAAIGSSDQRSLQAVAFSRRLPALDHYQVLDVPRAATRAQIMTAAEMLRQKYDLTTFPQIVREAVKDIQRRIDEAADTLKETPRRVTYDKLLHTRAGEGAVSIQQRLTQRNMAELNFSKARELTAHGDYYGAIVLLRQTVNFAPDHARPGRSSARTRNATRAGAETPESYQGALHRPENVES